MHLGVLVCGFEPCLIFKAWLSKIVKLGEVVEMVSRRIQVERHPSVVAGGRELLLWGRKMEVPAPHSVRATPSVHVGLFDPCMRRACVLGRQTKLSREGDMLRGGNGGALVIKPVHKTHHQHRLICTGI